MEISSFIHIRCDHKSVLQGQQQAGNPADQAQARPPHHGERGHHGRHGRPRRSRSEDYRRHDYYDYDRDRRQDGDYYSDYRDGDYDRNPRYGSGPRYPDRGYMDEHYYDEADYHRPLSYDRPRGARPLYRARSLPQRDFMNQESDYHPLHYSSRPHSTTQFRRRPYSNLGDYGYDQGINSYFGHDPYTERYHNENVFSNRFIIFSISDILDQPALRVTTVSRNSTTIIWYIDKILSYTYFLYIIKYCFHNRWGKEGDTLM